MKADSRSVSICCHVFIMESMNKQIHIFSSWRPLPLHPAVSANKHTSWRRRVCWKPCDHTETDGRLWSRPARRAKNSLILFTEAPGVTLAAGFPSSWGSSASCAVGRVRLLLLIQTCDSFSKRWCLCFSEVFQQKAFFLKIQSENGNLRS